MPQSHCDFPALLRLRRDCCQSLLQLSRNQREFIAAGDYDGLLRLLGQKQRVLAKLDAQKREVPDLDDQWKLTRAALSPQARAVCEAYLSEMETALSELVEQESLTTVSLSQRRDKTQQLLQELAAGAQVNQAYRDQLAPVTHRHLDIGK